jgi:small GTP-binding protein
MSTEIGGSPAPGLTLRQVFRGHEGPVGHVAWFPDGSYLASCSDDQTIRVWDVSNGHTVHRIEGGNQIASLAWSPDGTLLATSRDKSVILWQAFSWEFVRRLEGHQSTVSCLAWSPDGAYLASGSSDNTICLWKGADGAPAATLKGHRGEVLGVAWSPDSSHLASCSKDGTIRIWNSQTQQLFRSIKDSDDYVYTVGWSPTGQLVSGSGNNTICLWDYDTGHRSKVLEAHSSSIASIAFSGNGLWLASKSSDDTVIWRWDQLTAVATLAEGAPGQFPPKLSFHPSLPLLATPGENSIIRIWELDETILQGQEIDSVNYTTARLVLVGDSGVGKTGLGWRLAKGEFKEQSSTHGQQFWPIKQLGFKRDDGTDCEAVLWDLAGQHVYRQIHSIFLEKVTAALVLFDPTNRQDQLKGVQFWLEQLKGKGQLPPTILVGARVDRGAPTMSQEELDQFCQRYGIRGGYLSTSAISGEGLDELLVTLNGLIPWDEMTATVTTVAFKRIKDYMLKLKEDPDRKGVLVSRAGLRKQLEATDQEWEFTDAEMMTAVGHLETHGYVAVLPSSVSENHILLAPELLATLAASVVLLADRHPRELGAVNETELLRGTYEFDELKGLSADESQILLHAAILRFLQHNICFRETLSDDILSGAILLIFPGLIKQRRPLQDDLPLVEDVTYVVRGRVENLYASLVVLLGYTPSITRVDQWQKQAQYEMGEEQTCGFELIDDRDGEIEIGLYYGSRVPAEGRKQFQALFEQFLYQREVEVTRLPPVVCPKDHRQERATIIKRVRENKRFVHCEECGVKTDLPDFDKPQTIGISASVWLQREESAARLRSKYEQYLTNIKSYRRGRATPRAYISHHPDEAAWAKELIHHLSDAGVYVVEAAAQVQDDDFVIVLDSAAYQKAFKSAALAADWPLIQQRYGNLKLVSLALEGQSARHNFEACQPGRFFDETHYAVSLFDLVLNLYAIPLTHAAFEPLRQSLHAQWERTLAELAGQSANSHESKALKVFISYAHEDEAFKDDLLTVLKPLERKGLLKIWHDRIIEEGDEWRRGIEKAINECDVALLFVSKSFLASPFIQDKELPRLIERRKQQGLHVIPIIISPCMWDSERVLADLQAMPKDAKSVNSFREGYERDQVWTEIGKAIERRAGEESCDA